MALTSTTATLRDSILTDWDARWKLVAIGTVLIVVALLKTLPALGLAGVLTLGLHLVARTPLVSLGTRIGILFLALVPVTIVLPITVENGSGMACVIVVRSLTIGLLAYLLVRTTALATLAAAAHSLGLPLVLVQILQLTLRSADWALADWRAIRLTLRARGFVPRINRHTYETYGHAAAALLQRSFQRADRVQAAMLARGYTRPLLILDQFQTKPADRALALLLGTIGLGLFLVDYFFAS
ncbi:MAG: energy-coupling factor transporter transmembrane component T family protein [Gemmataceae bacterium]